MNLIRVYIRCLFLFHWPWIYPIILYIWSFAFQLPSYYVLFQWINMMVWMNITLVSWCFSLLKLKAKQVCGAWWYETARIWRCYQWHFSGPRDLGFKEDGENTKAWFKCRCSFFLKECSLLKDHCPEIFYLMRNVNATEKYKFVTLPSNLRITDTDMSLDILYIINIYKYK